MLLCNGLNVFFNVAVYVFIETVYRFLELLVARGFKDAVVRLQLFEAGVNLFMPLFDLQDGIGVACAGSGYVFG